MFEMPQYQDFPVSYSFEAVEGLPSSKAIPSALQYSPSWQVGASKFQFVLLVSGNKTVRRDVQYRSKVSYQSRRALRNLRSSRIIEA